MTRLPQVAEAYRSIAPTALLFDRVVMRRDEQRSVSLFLPSISPGSLSAGPMTALRFFAALGKSLGLVLRILTVNPWQRKNLEHERIIEEMIGAPVQVCHVGAGQTAEVSMDDVWVATSWETAAAAHVAVRAGVVPASQVVYLVQDYEPAFSPWSTAWATAQATYHAGFVLVVNSSPLACYLHGVEGIVVPDERILAPELDYERLAAVATSRIAGPREVFFYARPGSHRNLFGIGIAAARRAALLAQREWSLVLAGEDVDAPEVPGVRVRSLGRTDLDGYYSLMARTPVALSLMMSPHPSHPPLDWAISGGWAVTNDFGKCHSGLHSRLLSAPADPDALGQLLADTIDDAEIEPFALPSRSLGQSLGEVVAVVAEIVDRPCGG